MANAYNPNAGEAEAGGPLGLGGLAVYSTWPAEAVLCPLHVCKYVIHSLYTHRYACNTPPHTHTRYGEYHVLYLSPKGTLS